jgi:hypothetical protein
MTRVDEPLLLAQVVNVAIAEHRKIESPPELAPAKSQVTLRAETLIRRRGSGLRASSWSLPHASPVARVNHQDAGEPDDIPAVPSEPLPIVPPTPDPPSPSIESELQPPGAELPDVVEELPAGKRQLSEEDRQLWSKIEKYGQLRSINSIGLNIQPFSRVDPSDEDAAQRLTGRVPGNAAALLVREQDTIRYVSGPPQPSVNYAGLLSLGDFCHRPLYFEQVNVERYGTHRPILQPAFSAIQFFAGIPTLPYKMTIQHPNICYYYDHPFEAGRPAPWERQLPPLNGKAGLVQAGVVLGLIFLIP